MTRILSTTMFIKINKHHKANQFRFCIQYNMDKQKTFKPNLLDEPKDISSPEFFFSLSLLF